MPHPFQNRVALVTGASSGIGKALCIRLAKEGCRVGLVARRRELLEEIAGQIDALGGKSQVAVADVAIREEIHAATRIIQRSLGPIDYVIANAGIGTPTLLNPINIRDVEKMFQVNVLGTIYTIEAVLPEMLQRRQGHLVAVSSIAAFKGLPGESAYCATKAAINTYLEGLRIQLRDHRIPVTVVCPGFVKTPMTDVNQFHMPFLIDADRAADYIIYAMRKRKKVYRFPRPMSWLMRLTAWLPDWIIARAMRDYNENPPKSPLA